MTVYRVLFLVIFLAAVPLCFYRPNRKKSIVYVSVVFLYMFFMTAFRYGIGNDYDNYRNILYSVIEGDMSVSAIMRDLSMEPGYALLLKAVAMAAPAHAEYFTLNVICALLTLVPAAVIIVKYSKMPWLSCWLYVAITFLYNDMNFTRQSIAAAIVFAGFGFFEKRKHIGVLLVILIAACFHTSVLVLIPVYLLSLIKPCPLSMGIIGALAVAAFIFSEKLLRFAVGTFLPRYEHYLDSIFLTYGLSAKFLIVPAVLALVICTAYYLGWKNTGARAEVLTNFIFVNFFIWLFIVKHFIIERFTLPIYIFTLISLPDALCFLAQYSKEPVKSTIKSNSRHTIVPQKPVESKAVPKMAVFPAALTAVMGSTLWYNSFCEVQGVHGVFPYCSIFQPAFVMNEDAFTDFPRSVYVNRGMLESLYLFNKEDYSVIALSYGASEGKLEFPVTNMLRRMGFDEDFNNLEGKAYIGVVSNGQKIMERTDSESFDETMSLYGGKYIVNVRSTVENEGASVTVNGYEFITEPGTGVYFAAFDNQTQRLITVQGYNISSRNCEYIHSNGFNGLDYMPGFEDIRPKLDFDT